MTYFVIHNYDKNIKDRVPGYGNSASKKLRVQQGEFPEVEGIVK